MKLKGEKLTKEPENSLTDKQKNEWTIIWETFILIFLWEAQW